MSGVGMETPALATRRAAETAGDGTRRAHVQEGGVQQERALRKRTAARRALALAALSASVAAACVPTRGGWDTGALARRHPALAETRHRLGDLAPHVVHREGALVLFLCRWPTDRPVPVVLPADAMPDERVMLRRVLDAWTDTGIGVRFVEVDTAVRGIAIRFVQQGDPGPLPAGAGDTLADCRIDRAGVGDERVDARLERASVHLRRDQLDLLGLDERYGAALHELGHALGFASHAAAGDSVLRPSPEIARHAGRALRRGEWEGDPNVAALYAVPSGVVVGRVALGPEAAERAARLEAAARAAGLAGPYSRVGDRSARLFHRRPDGGEWALRLRPWPVTEGESGSIELVPNVLAAQVLVGAPPEAGGGRTGPVGVNDRPDSGGARSP